MPKSYYAEIKREIKLAEKNGEIEIAKGLYKLLNEKYPVIKQEKEKSLWRRFINYMKEAY